MAIKLRARIKEPSATSISDYYLGEFTFRFNRRKSRSRGKLFYRLVQQAVAVQSAPYKSLLGGAATHAADNHNL